MNPDDPVAYGVFAGNYNDPYLNAAGLTATDNSDGSTTFQTFLGSTLLSMDAPAAVQGDQPGLNYNLYIADQQFSFAVPLTMPAPGQTLSYGSASMSCDDQGFITVTAVGSDGSTQTYSASANQDGSLGIFDSTGEFFHMSPSLVKSITQNMTSAVQAQAQSSGRSAQALSVAWCTFVLGATAAALAALIALAVAYGAEIAAFLAEAAALRQQIAKLRIVIQGCARLNKTLLARLKALQDLLDWTLKQITKLQALLTALLAKITAIAAAAGGEVKACTIYLLQQAGLMSTRKMSLSSASTSVQTADGSYVQNAYLLDDGSFVLDQLGAAA